MRVRATIAYDGSQFFGFQIQPDKPTVVSALQDVLQSVGIDSKVVGSGRTDRGVHATGQVIHFDLSPYWQRLSKLQSHLNSKLEAIYIKDISKVESNFHAQYDAKQRVYRYIFKPSR